MIRRTIKKLVYQHEIVLHGLLVNLPKVGFRDVDKPVAKFKYQRRIRISPEPTSIDVMAIAKDELCYGNNVEVVDSDVKETG